MFILFQTVYCCQQAVLLNVNTIDVTFKGFKLIVNPAVFHFDGTVFKFYGPFVIILEFRRQSNDRISVTACDIHRNNIEFITKYNNYEIETFPNELLQVILNIINNAKDVLIERNTDKPKIEVHILKDEENIYCKITDNAGGIEEKIINKIFEPYFTTKESRGTGIGLYISKEIIQKHMNGLLIVKNNEVGAEFTISIPKKEEEV